MSLLPGMPPVEDPSDIYSADHVGNLSQAVRGIPARVYVPNSGSDTVDIIDPATFKIIGHFAVGRQPQHVVPSGTSRPLGAQRPRRQRDAVDPRPAKRPDLSG